MIILRRVNKMKVSAKNNRAAYNNELGIRLKHLRREKNMTQVELAGRLRVSRTCIANWEKGIRQPDYISVLNIVKLFGVPVDYLYGRTNHKYNIKIPDYLEFDLTKLNSEGIMMFQEYYKYLTSNERFRAE